MSGTFNAGVLVVRNGSTTVRIIGASSILPNMRPFDAIAIEGDIMNAVASLTNENHFELARPFVGPNQDDATFMLWHMPVGWGVPATLHEDIAVYLRLLGQAIPFTQGQLDAANVAASIATVKAGEAAASTNAAQQFAADAAAAGNQTFQLWAGLAALAGTRANQRAEVVNDAGTHTDPVVGGTVANGGVYAWSVSPAGWKRVADTGIAKVEARQTVTEQVTAGQRRIGAGGWFTVIHTATGKVLDGLDLAGVRKIWKARIQDLEVAGELRAILPGAPRISPNIEGGWGAPIVTGNGKLLGGYKKDGSFWAINDTGVLVRVGGTVADTGRSYSYDPATGVGLNADTNTIQFFIVTGDSISVGGNQDPATVPVSTTPLHPGNSLMFNVGPWPNGRPVTSFSDLREMAYGDTKETICSRFADALQTGFQATLGRKHPVLMAVAGWSGTGYKDIKRGSPYYAELLRLVLRAKEIAAANGERIVVPAVIVLSGGNDNTTFVGTRRLHYARMLSQWRRDLEDDIRAILGQTVPVRLYPYQVNRAANLTAGNSPSQVTLAQLDASKFDPNIECLGPAYFQTIVTTGDNHPVPMSEAEMGQTYGNAVFNDLFGPSWQPLHIVEAWWVANNQIRLRYNRDVSVDASDSIVNVTALGTGLGFDFYDFDVSEKNISFSNVFDTVLSVAAVAGDPSQLLLTLASSPTGRRPRLLYACRGTGDGAPGRLTGPRGGIREGASFATGAGGGPLYHWACQQVIDLPKP